MPPKRSQQLTEIREPFRGIGQADAHERDDLKGNPRPHTGIHPAIRATSTEEDGLALPAPILDDPEDQAPGELENPRYIDDEDFVEDAFEEV